MAATVAQLGMAFFRNNFSGLFKDFDLQDSGKLLQHSQMHKK